MDLPSRPALQRVRDELVAHCSSQLWGSQMRSRRHRPLRGQLQQPPQKGTQCHQACSEGSPHASLPQLVAPVRCPAHLSDASEHPPMCTGKSEGQSRGLEVWRCIRTLQPRGSGSGPHTSTTHRRSQTPTVRRDRMTTREMVRTSISHQWHSTGRLRHGRRCSEMGRKHGRRRCTLDRR